MINLIICKTINKAIINDWFYSNRNIGNFPVFLIGWCTWENYSINDKTIFDVNKFLLNSNEFSHQSVMDTCQMWWWMNFQIFIKSGPSGVGKCQQDILDWIRINWFVQKIELKWKMKYEWPAIFGWITPNHRNDHDDKANYLECILYFIGHD